MNRYNELELKETRIAVLGLNTEGLRYGLDFAGRFHTVLYDEVLPQDLRLEDFLLGRGIESGIDQNLVQLGHSESDLRSAGVFYLNGLSSSVMDWESIKRTATIIGKSISVGDWIILGPHIDPDLAEVVLLDIIERRSGLKLGVGFEMAFHPNAVGSHNFANMGNEMKMSHNLIIDHVERILSIRRGGRDFGSSQLNYKNLEAELLGIRDKVRELWIPMLNGMTRETFQEFFDLSVNNGFLDVYSHLRLSTESKVNWRRFFGLVLQFGVRKELEDLIIMDQHLKAV